MTGRRLVRLLGAAYLLALAASHLVRLTQSPAPPAGDLRLIQTRQVPVTPGSPSVRIAFLDLNPEGVSPPALVLHGSPGDHRQVGPLAAALATFHRVLAPDLPGFGGSTVKIPDYSIAAHAEYLVQLLDSLRISTVHLVGYSMGGGVAIELADRVPSRVASLTLVSSIGVQEYELLGDYWLNHSIHGLQLAGLWAVTELTPHFGWLDDAMLGLPYARNFYDTDQRPLRGALTRWSGPTLIVQGERDGLVPPPIAREHGRIVPQSEVRLLAGGHFMVFTQASMVADTIETFLSRVANDSVRLRSTAEPERIAAAAQPLDPAQLPRPAGFSLAIVLVLLAAATLVSEDLACIAAGLLVSRGTLGFLPATAACLIGIAIGDLLLFLTGRIFGRPALRYPPLRWLVSEEDVIRSSRWFARQGLRLVIATRFMPGTRLPTYVAAGVLRTSLPAFTVAFLIAATLWTPLLVGVSALVGAQLTDWVAGHRAVAGPVFVVGLVLLFLLIRLTMGLLTWRGRRLLLSRWRRVTRWEFWPLRLFYLPIIAGICWQALRHRSLRLFTAANPGIPGGGLLGESKSEILDLFVDQDHRLAAYSRLPGSVSVNDRLALVEEFMATNQLKFPVVLKPDVGERGRGVHFPGSLEEVETLLRQTDATVMVQEHLTGREFGIFYYRFPDSNRGTVFAITDKRFPEVVGDGTSTLERLILADDRAVCSARLFLAAHIDRLDEVIPAGERVALTRLGTHSQGSLFLDGGRLLTPALESAVDALSQAAPGFSFGRYDVRAPSEEALQAGEFRVLELNGVSSEATSIYDPANSLWRAWDVLLAQWRLAFEMGAMHRDRGVRPTSWAGLKYLYGKHRQARRMLRHPSRPDQG